ncbi:hypothetical protein QE404_002237 [Chryseobacterium camelliae]|uniref:Uncharacterized protein n=1 Tax=Chryseobacterium camelliae TaxID=1265445 RepID=A0ABU0TJ69_9FLAO|nr:hypothetical protein [Chryseobacterium camelliae]
METKKVSRLSATEKALEVIWELEKKIRRPDVLSGGRML